MAQGMLIGGKPPPDPKANAFHFEACKAGLTQTRNGYFLRLELDPMDLPPELAEAPMKQRWLVVLTAMPDDMPEPSQREIDDGERAIKTAAILCKDGDFQHWLGASNEERAVIALRKKLCINSRSELKTNTRARRELYRIYDEFFESLPVSI